ncbi:hypothetical protein DSCW_38250 [Desulfosarcina widdelii]|uniref:Porin n=1 Tax=Desulfosarcina widdelii TaxID=947919 RepID=A0A5K7Z5X3_9BACT|nr:hypothetical protein [Desulfosarcina widdelii]BBO76408.1 hypothetical protein DSCW_38250 [Desulfosarcina widdelii]
MKKLFIIFAILCLAAPAMAADWNFYGSARFATFSVDVDPDLPGVDSDTDTQWAQQGNSRIGATVKFNDQIGGGFEMSDSFGKRKLYGTYTFGNGGELLIGQTYTPSALFYSNSVYDGDGDLLGVGEFYEGRLPMIQFKMGGLKVALISPSTVDYELTPAVEAEFLSTDGVTTIDAEVEAAENYDTDVTLPKIEVGYGFKMDMFFADVFAGYQTYELDANNAGTDYDVDSYVIGAGVGANFGAFFAKVGAHMGQNLGNYGAYNPVGLNDEMSIAGGTEKDADGLGYLAVLGFSPSEMLTIEAGYGYEEAEVDDSNNTESAWQWYVNCTVNIAPGFFIVPEVGQINYEDDVTSNDPQTTYFGAKWQINF